MTPRTLTRPLDDHSYWRRLLAVAHPDRNGSDSKKPTELAQREARGMVYLP